MNGSSKFWILMASLVAGCNLSDALGLPEPSRDGSGFHDATFFEVDMPSADLGVKAWVDMRRPVDDLSEAPGDAAVLREELGTQQGDLSVQEGGEMGGDSDGGGELEALPVFVKPSDGRAEERFGFHVASRGRWTVVGAPYSQQEKGAAYLFGRDEASGTWSQQAILRSSQTAQGDLLGISSAVGTNMVAVGAPLADDYGMNAGAVYLFAPDASGQWVQTGKLKAFPSEFQGQFGNDLDFDENRLIVGAFLTQNGRGIAHLFGQDGQGNWNQEATLEAPVREKGDEFGRRVLLRGDTAIVSAHREDGPRTGSPPSSGNTFTDSGAVYVFVLQQNRWVLQARLHAPKLAKAQFFGSSIDFEGDTLVVGASGEGSTSQGVEAEQNVQGAPFSGAVYVFKRTGGTWALEAFLKSSNSEAGDSLGYSVDLHGDHVLVGALGEGSQRAYPTTEAQDNGAPESGAAYLFERDAAGKWRERAYLKSLSPSSGSRFGQHVALGDDLTLLIGSPFDPSGARGIGGDFKDQSAKESGALWIYPPPR